MASFFTDLCARYLPNAFVFSVILTMIVFSLGIATQGQSPLMMATYWGDGLWKLLQFSMQMVLILVTGHVLAQTKLINHLLKKLASRVHTPAQSIILVTLVSTISSWVNWGFGLIVGGLLAVEVAKRVRTVSFPLLIASAYSGFVVWHGGISGSIPLKLASASGFMSSILGNTPIKTSDTIFAPMSLTLSLILLLTLPLINVLMHPDKLETVELKADLGNEVEEYPKTPAARLEHSRILSFSLCALMGFYLYKHFSSSGGLNLNIVILLFFFLGLLFHGNLSTFMQAFSKACKSSSGIILQFPIYAGIMGMMSESGLARTFSEFFVSIATADTLPLLTYLSAGIVNFFVPSGGGQWAVQGPIMIPAAQHLGASISKVSMALAWGDAWTNMVQPFWALPLLSIAGLGLKDIMGYCIVVFLWTGLVSTIVISIF
jgi:short-chain fatty acids transporter